MSTRWPGFIGKRIPNPGGSQKSPEAGPRRVLIGSWLIAFLFGVIGSGLSQHIDERMFVMACGVPPVVLFIGLSVLGLLTRKVAWGFVGLWVLLCGGVVYLSILELV